jgi:hypothetical protein
MHFGSQTEPMKEHFRVCLDQAESAGQSKRAKEVGKV